MAKRPASDRGRELLEKSTIFGTLDEKARREIAAYAKPRSYTAGAQICRLGDQGDSMMAIVIAPWTSTGYHPDGKPFARPGRATMVFSRNEDGWLCMHSHMSLNRGVPQVSHANRPVKR